MKIFCIVLFVLCCIAECFTVPMFLKYQWPKKCWKSFRWKMVCSALFFACGLLAMKISGNNSEYAKLIMWGLAMGWLGDIFLHLITDKIYITGLGIFAFLAGHIFYIAAFQKAIRITYPDANFITWYEAVAVLVLVGAMAAYVLFKKVKAKVYMIIPVVLYAITISYMLVKAFRLCIGIWAYGMYDTLPFIVTCICVALGALLFVLSDGSLGLIMFCGFTGRKKLKWFNIGTYYAAQVLLASSIFVLQTVSYAY